MSFLKKLGQGIVKGLQIAGRVEGVIGPELPGGVRSTIDNVLARGDSELLELSGIITQVEAIGATLNLPGPDKLKAAEPLVAQLLLRSPLLLEKKVKDTALFQQAAAELAQGMVDLLNSLE